MAGIQDLKHPNYTDMLASWTKFRYVYEGGQPFIDKYVTKLSNRENDDDFTARKEMTYLPAHAKAAIVEVKNAICQRISDIIRIGGADSYQVAIKGESTGVDRTGNSMNGFIGRVVIPEMLAMGKVGIYIDRDIIPEGVTKRDTAELNPYVYSYETEDILNWRYDSDQELELLLLRDYTFSYDEETGLPVDLIENFRYLERTASGVTVTFFDADGAELSTQSLALAKIPFVVAEITQSLLTDVANHQIALVNMASTDVNYAIKSNYPFYTEQYDPIATLPHLRHASSAGTSAASGEAAEAGKGKPTDIKTGTAQGRRYPKSLERPGFIHPSSEPLKISMEKEEQLKKEIRQLTHLAVANLEPRRASADSKAMDQNGLETGLSYIGLEMEYVERQIAEMWGMYSGNTDIIKITYPSRYSLRNDDNNRKEVKELNDIKAQVPSLTFQKAIAKEMVTTILGSKISQEEFQKITGEIDSAAVLDTDPETIRADHEAGFVSTELASTSRGYPVGEVEKAKKDHAERLARISESQSKKEDKPLDGGARGVPDIDDTPKQTAEVEKE